MREDQPEFIGVLAALQPELGELRAGARARSAALGVSIMENRQHAAPLLLAVSGVGKVAAARAAAALVCSGATRLLVVGTCGGLSADLDVGDLVHCSSASQADLAVREGRDVAVDEALAAGWRSLVGGGTARFLTADRPVLRPWRRRALLRAYPGSAVADMETAAAARIAQGCELPWAALRVVTDRAGFLGGRTFARNFPRLAGLAAETIPDLVSKLAADDDPAPEAG